MHFKAASICNRPAIGRPFTKKLNQTASSDSKIVEISTELAQQFGDTQAVKKMLATLRNTSSDLDTRRQALQGIAFQQRPELLPELKNLVNDSALRRDAIRAMASYDDRGLTDLLLDKYDAFSADEKLDTVQTLASRRNSARALTQAIDSGKIPKRDIPAIRLPVKCAESWGNSFYRCVGTDRSVVIG